MHPFLQVQLRQRFRRPRQPPCSRPPGGKQGARKGCVRVFDRSHIRARGHAGRFVVKGISGEQAVMGICIRRAEGSSSHIRREMQKHNFFSFAVHRRSPHPASNTCNCKVAGSYLRYRTSTSISVRCKCSCTGLDAKHTPSKGLMPPITACPHWSDVLGGLPWQGVGQLAPPPASNLRVMSTHPCPITPSSPILTSIANLSPCPSSIPILSPEFLAHGHRTSA